MKSPGDYEWQSSRKANPSSFEDMMSRFKQTSEDKISDLKRGESRGYSRRGNGNGQQQRPHKNPPKRPMPPPDKQVKHPLPPEGES